MISDRLLEKNPTDHADFRIFEKVDLRCRKIREVCDEGKLKLVTSCDFEHLICHLGMKIFQIWMTRVKISHFFQVFKFLKTLSRGKVHNEDNFSVAHTSTHPVGEKSSKLQFIDLKYIYTFVGLIIILERSQCSKKKNSLQNNVLGPIILQ